MTTVALTATMREIMSLPTASIAVGERIGFYNAAHAAHLAQCFAADGQHDPIHVRRNGNAAKRKWTLIAGLHRLRGAEAAGWAEINAIQVADASDSPATLRRLELSENLDHRQRRPIERAMFMVELARLEEEADHPGRAGEPSQVRAARVRWNAEEAISLASGDADITMISASNWRDRAAAALGCSVPTLARYQRLHREIVEALGDLALVQRLNDHPLGESMIAMLRVSQLGRVDKLAVKIGGDPHAARRALVEIIIADPAIPSVDEAYARLTNGTRKGGRSPVAALNERAFAHWHNLGAEDQHGVAVQIADIVTDQTAAAMIARFAARGLL